MEPLRVVEDYKADREVHQVQPRLSKRLLFVLTPRVVTFAFINGRKTTGFFFPKLWEQRFTTKGRLEFTDFIINAT